MKNNFATKKLIGYLVLPLAFFIITLLFLYCTFKPFVEIAANTWSAISGDSWSDDTEIYNDIFTDSTLLGYEGTVKASDITFPTFGTVYGKIEIFTNDTVYSMPLIFGDNNACLKVGAGHYIGSHFPGENSTILVSGHNTNFFNCLKYTKVGETIEITTNYGKYKYEITDISPKHKNDKTAYNLAAEKETLVLYTCYPFDVVGYKVNRYYVTATLITGPMIDPYN